MDPLGAIGSGGEADAVPVPENPLLFDFKPRGVA